MGLRMDIHAPSVASHAGGSTEGSSVESKSVLNLISEKDKIEDELKALGDVLESVRSNIGSLMNTLRRMRWPQLIPFSTAWT